MRLPFSTARKSHHSSSLPFARSMAALILVWVGFSPGAVGGADLLPAASAAFDHYVQLTQAGFDRENRDLGSFLWVDRLPYDERQRDYTALRNGQVVIERLETPDGSKIQAPGALIHHWTGTVFVPGASLAQVLAFEQDYDHQQPYFTPDVMRSKILLHNGPDFTIELRFYKKKVISAVLDTRHEVHYAQIDPKHAWSRSWTTRVQQIDHAGQSNESLEPEGHDDGFLWRMNTYWRFEEKDGGVYIESQSVSLTRDIPAGLGWVVGPYIASIPRESLTFTLAATQRAMLQQIASNRSH